MSTLRAERGALQAKAEARARAAKEAEEALSQLKADKAERERVAQELARLAREVEKGAAKAQVCVFHARLSSLP